jgi:TRAP-type C4-dicarboxylate transport system permease large subunit
LSVSWKEKLSSLKGTWGVIAIFGIMMGGIYTGWVAPSAAGAIGGALALIIVILRRKMSWSGMKEVCLETMLVFSSIFIIVVGGSLFSRFWAISGLIEEISNWITGLGVPPIIIILMFMFIYLILGCFLDPVSMMVLTLPLFYPIITTLGYSGIWFCILVVKVIEIGLLTPPVGFNVYVVKSAAGDTASLEEVFSGITPFLLLEMIVMSILIAFPQISLWLPAMMG